MVRQKSDSVKCSIDDFGITHERITGRAGLALVSRYLREIGITALLAKRFWFVKKHTKGTALVSLFHQILLFFFDGTDFHMTRFDQLKQDAGYAGIIETQADELISSHAAKRFFGSFSLVRVWLFRKVLKQLFVWRLKQEQPQIISLGIDTMVLDNDDAHQREGVEVTYKKVKGFQPLQVFWGRYLIDAVFRNGKAHSNHGNHVQRVLTDLVKLIRREYREDVPIIVSADAGFFDEKLFVLCDRLHIGFRIGGKLYEDVKAYAASVAKEQLQEFTKGKQTWSYCEFGSRRKTGSHFWRTIYASPHRSDDGQGLFEFARPDTVIITNLGMPNTITDMLQQAGEAFRMEAQQVIDSYHLRARDELVNRGLKDFGTEHLPFKRFASNAAYYYLMTIAFVLFEAFKYDLDTETVPVTWYAETFRRRCLDIAGKLVRSGGKTLLKLSQAAIDALNFGALWNQSAAVVKIAPSAGG